MDLEILDRPVADLTSELMADDLTALEAELDAAAEALKRRKETWAAVITRRYGEKAQSALLADGKDTGTVNVDVSNDISLKATFPKKVEWDQKLLSAALDKMAPEDARHYAKVKLEVEERKFSTAPPAVKQALLPARTVKVGKPSFTFKAESREAA